jgi:peptidoglycan/xylan/chitin deacetylase (PgdA/CDA1 family)
MFQSISNKREFLATAFGHLGVLTLLERIAAVRWPSLIVLTYHRIADPAHDPFYEPVISATPESFKIQVDWLCDNFRIVALDELIAQIEPGSRWHEPVVLLTFDDGYRDNFDLAVPILRERSVPATFFIPTTFLEAPQLPWWDHVAYVIKQTKSPRLTLEPVPDSIAPMVIDLTARSRFMAIKTIIGAFLDKTIVDDGWFLQQLAERAAVDADVKRLGCQLFMSWDQVRELADSGSRLTIGSHGHSHSRLAGLDRDRQRFELTESKRILETHLGREVSALAYPYGWPGTYTTETKELAALVGYRIAFASREDLNRPGVFDRFDMSRLGVGLGDSVPLLRARIALYAAFGRSFL